MLAPSPIPILNPLDDSKITQSDAELRSHVARVLDSTYELDREIGRGGMGIVYLAKDKRLKRPVAIKLLPPELAFRSEIRSRFLREAETAAQLSHPCIVPIYSVDEKDGLVFFVMAFVPGDNLAKRIHEQGPMDPTEVRRVLRDVGDALAYAHAHGVVHRDIKPDNILLDGPSGRPMVTDFGIARAISEGADARLTATGIAIGTPAFMSPEQSAGDRDLDGRSDLYSLGVVAYQMLCGDLPFNATNTPALLVKHLSERPIPIDQRRANIPPDLARAVMLCLEKTPDDRFPSAAAFVTALDSGVVPNLPAPRPMPSMAGQSPYAPPATYGNAGMEETGAYLPNEKEFDRWNNHEVVAFRRKFAPFLFVGAVSVVLGILNIGPSFMGLVALYGVYLAYKYARLWSDGYDWHDVFRQPRERLFSDLMAERVDDVQSLWSQKKRVLVRERHRKSLTSPGFFQSAGSTPVPSAIRSNETASLGAGPQAAMARQALNDRDEISRLIATMPKGEAARVADVPKTAARLAQSIQDLTKAIGDVDRAGGGSSPDAIDKEISLLESQANPLDRVASEERVRRLAVLKRNRRTAAGLTQKRADMKERVDGLAVALTNIKLDVLRLKTGTQSWQNVTSVAEQALALAREVDSAVYVADEMNRLQPRSSSARADSRLR